LIFSDFCHKSCWNLGDGAGVGDETQGEKKFPVGGEFVKVDHIADTTDSGVEKFQEHSVQTGTFPGI
jgi:hypothetical protein